jgi:hypothetical protein
LGRGRQWLHVWEAVVASIRFMAKALPVMDEGFVCIFILLWPGFKKFYCVQGFRASSFLISHSILIITIVICVAF